MTFTGYTLEELNDLSLPGTRGLLTWTDVLVDGPYEASRPDRTRNCIGNNVGIIYRVDQLITPEGRVPALGDVVEIVQKLGKRMDVRWLTDQELTPAPCVDLQARLGELGYPPIQTAGAAHGCARGFIIGMPNRLTLSQQIILAHGKEVKSSRYDLGIGDK